MKVKIRFAAKTIWSVIRPGLVGLPIGILLLLAIYGIIHLCDKASPTIIVSKPIISDNIIVSEDFIWTIENPVVLILIETENGVKKWFANGFFISQKGKFARLLTCEHVIKDEEKNNRGEIKVCFNKKIYPVTVISTNFQDDIAALQIEVPENSHVPIAKLGDSDRLQEKEFVISCGYNEMEGKLSRKIIRFGLFRGKSRLFPSLIRTDIPGQLGDSGSPLFNFKGKVIGVLGKIFEGPPDYKLDISIASLVIPINAIKPFLNSLPPKPSEIEN